MAEFETAQPALILSRLHVVCLLRHHREDRAGTGSNGDILDCLIVEGRPAGLITVLYLARFKRRFAVVDSGTPQAAWIPTSHNIPFFTEGISDEYLVP